MEAQLIAPDRLAHVPEPIRRTLAQVKRELANFYGNKLQKVVLFGSYARGDFHDESDIDIMPIIEGSTSADLQREGLFDLAYSYMEKEQIHVSIVSALSDHYKRAETFLLMFVQKDGIELGKRALQELLRRPRIHLVQPGCCWLRAIWQGQSTGPIAHFSMRFGYGYLLKESL